MPKKMRKVYLDAILERFSKGSKNQVQSLNTEPQRTITWYVLVKVSGLAFLKNFAKLAKKYLEEIRT